MHTLPAELLSLIVIFQPLFTKPVWEHVKVLLLGALLARGKRTVTACLRVVGLSEEKAFQKYHRVLNRASWSALQASRILFGVRMAHRWLPQRLMVLAVDGGYSAFGLRQHAEPGSGDAPALGCQLVSRRSEANERPTRQDA